MNSSNVELNHGRKNQGDSDISRGTFCLLIFKRHILGEPLIILKDFDKSNEYKHRQDYFMSYL